jgi:hypothetical protein
VTSVNWCSWTSPDSLSEAVADKGAQTCVPFKDRLKLDYMLVDTASRPGMSGAPVGRSWTNQVVEPGIVGLGDAQK